ncbi:accessory gene regulator protein B [Desulfocucumis palustris]|uniref:Accessory gene regulator protein B n=2 Tax=Desulfocucumis palustris TaxID=1898651 RepID=A0A2L2X9A1_9FIRM|nr:accessory gene regulator protein B [Desulfocucumis palustris]
MFALLGSFLSQFGQGLVDAISAGAFIAGLAAMILFAPMDSPSAPIISSLRKKKLKIISIAFVFLETFAVLLIRESSWQYAVVVQSCVALTLLWVSFMLTRKGHKLMSLIDKISFKKT